jgi:hypothetical protein
MSPELMYFVIPAKLAFYLRLVTETLTHAPLAPFLLHRMDQFQQYGPQALKIGQPSTVPISTQDSDLAPTK